MNWRGRSSRGFNKCAIHPPLLAYSSSHVSIVMAIRVDDVLSLLGPFGEVLRVEESDAFLPGAGPSDCLEVLVRLKRGTEISKLLSRLESMGYSIGMVKFRGRRLKFVLFESS